MRQWSGKIAILSLNPQSHVRIMIYIESGLGGVVWLSLLKILKKKQKANCCDKHNRKQDLEPSLNKMSAVIASSFIL